MNHASNPNGKAIPVPTILKAALVVSVLGFIVTIADKSHLTPAEFHASALTSVASVDPGAMATAKRNATTMPDGAESQPAADGRTDLSTTHYPALSPDAVSDESEAKDNHPASF